MRDKAYKISLNDNGDLTYNDDKVMIGSTVSNEVSLVQNTGQSTTSVMSQKAVSDSINKLKNAGYLYAGIATPTTNPGTPDGPVFYIATQAGTYSNFNSIEVTNGESAILKWNNGTWAKSSFKPMTDFNSVFDNSGNSLAFKFDELENISNIYAENVKTEEYKTTVGCIDTHGNIRTFGHRTDKISVKEGTTVMVKASGTPSYAIISKVNISSEGQETYIPIVRAELDKDKYEYTFNSNCDVIFSSKDQVILVSRYINIFQLKIDETNEKTNEKIEANIDLIKFLGVATDSGSQYNLERHLNLPNTTKLNKGDSFIVKFTTSLSQSYPYNKNDISLKINNLPPALLYINDRSITTPIAFEANEPYLIIYDGDKYLGYNLFGGASLGFSSFGRFANFKVRDLTEGCEFVDYHSTGYRGFLCDVNAGELIYINVGSTSSIPLISKVNTDGTYSVLEYGSSRFTGYWDKNIYIYHAKETMKIRIVYYAHVDNNIPPIAFAISSYLSSTLVSYGEKISQNTKDIELKASIEEVNKRAYITDLNTEITQRKADIAKLEEEIKHLEPGGAIEPIVKQYLEEHPELISSVPDNSLTDKKFTEDVRHKKANYYNSVADMKADNTLEVGMTAVTLGYYEPNDNGGGTYIIKSSGEPNTGDCIAISNNLKAHLICEPNEYRLSQWGVKGDRAINSAKELFGLTTQEITSVNPTFGDDVSDATYVIQYLIKKKPNNRRIVLDKKLYYINYTIYLLSWTTIEGTVDRVRGGLGSRIQNPNYVDSDSAMTYDKSIMMMITPDKNLFEIDPTYNVSTQQVTLKNFCAVGCFGKAGYADDTKQEHAGNFFEAPSGTDSKSLSKWLFKDLCISNFKNGFVKHDGVYWVTFDGCFIGNMEKCGLNMVNLELEHTNACTITNCSISYCGMEWYKNSDGSYDIRKKSYTGRPLADEGSCITISGAGNIIRDCDLQHSYCAIWIHSQCHDTIVSGIYSEDIKRCQVYEDYSSLTQSTSTVIGGYYSNADQQEETGIKRACRADFSN